LSLLAAGVAQADTLLNYTFDAGTYFDFLGGPSNTVTGTFTYDATTQVLSAVNYDRGGDIFTVGSVSGPGGSNPMPPTELFFGDTASGDYDVYEFQGSLALGGTDTILSGTHPAIYISTGGSISATPTTAVPEPAGWAMMLAGFGLVGCAIRGRALTVRPAH
jgi:hypothetical protein